MKSENDKGGFAHYTSNRLWPPKLPSPALPGSGSMGIISAFYSTPVLENNFYCRLGKSQLSADFETKRKVSSICLRKTSYLGNIHGNRKPE